MEIIFLANILEDTYFKKKSPPHVQICSPYCCELLAGKGCKDA